MMVRTFRVVAALAMGLVAAARGSDEAGLAFLSENRGKPGVMELPSGLQYKVIQRGEGKFHPTERSPCTCHYHGTLIDGTVFDSSMERNSPIDFAPNQVIKGWTEAMQLMVEGDVWELYVPSELAYGERGSPPKIPANSVLIFKIQILSINGDKVPAFRCDVPTLADCSDREKGYIEKVKAKSVEYTKELERLQSIANGKLKPELLEWVHQRANILGQLAIITGTEKALEETKEEL